MSTTTNPNSTLFKLRALAPGRPLSHYEGLRIAELQANHLLDLAGVREAGTPAEIVSGLPFVEVALRSDLPVSGLTNWFKPRWLILLNGDEPAVRRRFSLMHEFKHILDHGGISYLYPSTMSLDSERRAELVADYFAACLLMPKGLVKRRYCQGQQRVSELAAEFGVSPVAMRYRLQQLGLVDSYRRCQHAYQSTGELRGYFRQAPRPALAA